MLIGTTWANFLCAQGTTGTTGGTANQGGGTAPATPLQPGTVEEVPPARPALPETGNAPRVPGTGTLTTPAAPEKASPFSLPPPTTEAERDQRSPFGRTNAGASSVFGARLAQPGETPDSGTATTTSESAGPKPLDTPTTFTAPGFYGGGGVSLTTGTGRLARPREKWSISAGMGFDDNTLQTPTNGGGTDDVVIRQTVPGQTEISQNVQRRVPTGQFRVQNNVFIPIFRTVTEKVVLRPAVAEQELVQRFPGLPDRDRESSVVSSLDVSYQAQWAKGRSAFTMDARGGVDYYWSRSQDPLEYNGSLSLLYIRKLNPRLQFSTALSAAYTSQPDFNRVNAGADASVTGRSSIASSKTDFTYRWNRRFNTVSSITADIRLQEEKGFGAGSFSSYGLGQEFRYLWSPKFTLVGDVRYSKVAYLDSDNGNSTVSVLGGVDWDLSRKLRATARVGQSLRSFDTVSDQSSSPHGELTVSWQPSRRNSFSFSSRYGFEEASVPGAEQLVFRNSISYQRSFSPKLFGSATFNLPSYTTKSPGTDASSTQKVLDGSLSLRYIFSRKFNVGMSYSYTQSTTDSGLSDYYKNRLFFTGTYDF